MKLFNSSGISRNLWKCYLEFANYHSSSITIPAPVCVTNANVPVAPGNGDASCNSGTISCNPIPAPTCTANNTAQCTAVMGNVDARGIFTCTGRAPNESPFCSMVPGAVELNPLSNRCMC